MSNKLINEVNKSGGATPHVHTRCIIIINNKKARNGNSVTSSAP